MGGLKTRDRKTRHSQNCRTGKRKTGKRGTKLQDWKTRNRKKRHRRAGLENAELENVAPNCRTGKRGKRHVWKAKLLTPHADERRLTTIDMGRKVGDLLGPVRGGRVSWVPI